MDNVKFNFILLIFISEGAIMSIFRPDQIQNSGKYSDIGTSIAFG